MHTMVPSWPPSEKNCTAFGICLRCTGPGIHWSFTPGVFQNDLRDNTLLHNARQQLWGSRTNLWDDVKPQYIIIYLCIYDICIYYYIHIGVYIYMYMYICIRIRICICMYVYIYTCIYICICICICMWNETHFPRKQSFFVFLYHSLSRWFMIYVIYQQTLLLSIGHGPFPEVRVAPHRPDLSVDQAIEDGEWRFFWRCWVQEHILYVNVYIMLYMYIYIYTTRIHTFIHAYIHGFGSSWHMQTFWRTFFQHCMKRQA